MPHPTHSPKRTVFHGSSIIADSIGGTSVIDGAIRGPHIAADSIGITQAADALQRNLLVVPLGNTVATAFNTVVFRAPASGAKITAAYVCPGANMNHDGGESDTWIFSLAKFSSSVKTTLSKNAPSLSNQTLSATAFKTLPINNGAATLTSGNRLRLEASISGTPDALQWPVAVIEWLPYTNA